MKYRYILALDPSGSFNEGKGTTGWCLYDAGLKIIKASGSICAIDYNSMEEYWQAQLDLCAYYMQKNTVLVCEDYLLYASKALEQSNSRMETSKLIGCVQLECWRKGWAYIMQPAVEVKNRWTNAILVYKGILKKKERGYIPATGEMLNFTHHTLDAIRHAIHFASFKNK